MLKRIILPSLTMASSLTLLACGTSALPRPQGPFPKNEKIETKDESKDWNPSSSSKKIDPSIFEANNPGYCGYEFKKETDQKTIRKISSSFAQNWQSRGAYKNSNSNDQYYYDGMRIDLLDGLYTELKLHFRFDFTVAGPKEVPTKIEIAREVNVAEYFISQPTKVGNEENLRLLVLSTPEGSTKCMAVGFRFDSREKVDELFATNFIRTSSYGNGVTTKSLADFFKDASLGLRYEIKK